METCCDLCLQRLSYKSTKKRFKKMMKLKNQNIFLKTNIFKFYNRLKISTDSVELGCDTPDAPDVNKENKSRPYKTANK